MTLFIFILLLLLWSLTLASLLILTPMAGLVLNYGTASQHRRSLSEFAMVVDYAYVGLGLYF
jgi:uncharacterized membrane protein